jgi:hypothetical protein
MWLKLAGITAKRHQGPPAFKPAAAITAPAPASAAAGHLRDDGDEQRDAHLAFERAPTNKIRKAAIASGMKTCWPTAGQGSQRRHHAGGNRQGRPD